MRRLALVMLLVAAPLLVAACASRAKLMTEVQKADRWDVFYHSKGTIKVMVIPANKWTFEDGCFVAEKPVPYIQCEVFRVRPCTEKCDG